MLVVFVAPFFSENAKLFLDRTCEVPGARVAVVTQDVPDYIGHALRARLVEIARVEDAFRTADIVAAANGLAERHGPIHRLIGVMEQVQLPVAEARAELGLPGMKVEPARRFRDKTLMKDCLREAGLPVARHRLVNNTRDALGFGAEVGYPIIVKPPAGAASQTTYRVHDETELKTALGPTSVAAGGVVLLEELLTGTEHSFEAFVRGGEMLGYSTSDYHPSCLDVMQNAWIQWVVVLPRDYLADDIARIGTRALEVLGLETGMCHLEWFRRPDGSVAISEVGARPPGAQIPTMISRAHDIDCIGAWARLMVLGEMEPLPPRRYAVGTAYLRGQGEGRVVAVHGMDSIYRKYGHLITDVRLPQARQEKAKSYEGEGFVMIRHAETSVVRDALTDIISSVRVELGGAG